MRREVPLIFTDMFVEKLKPTKSRYEKREVNAHGNGVLALRVSPNGHKAWQYLYTLDGRDRRMTLGDYPAMTLQAARVAKNAAELARQLGRDPGAVIVDAREAERRAPTVAALAALYLEQHARGKKDGGARDGKILDRDVLPVFGAHKAEAIERRDVRDLLKRIVDRGAPIQANRTLAVVRKMFNWGISEDLVPTNPCIGIKPPGKETQCDRVLSETELRSVLAVLPNALGMAPASRLALQFQLVTAQRCGEALSLRWDELDLAAGWWTIPAAKAKNGKSHRVPLSPQALDLLARARALNPDRSVVFPSHLGDQPMVETAVGRALARNLAQFSVAAFTPHDLRRTAASHMTGMKVPRLVVSKILNHAEQGVTAVYDRHSYDSEKREALEMWGKRLVELGWVVK